MALTPKQKIPVILYEENKDGKTNIIPYISVEKNEEMPKVLFISEYKDTGETEPDGDGGMAQIVDMIVHKYVDMEHLVKVLDKKTNDKVRVALGMKPLEVAKKEGQKILDKVVKNANGTRDDLLYNKSKRDERAFALGSAFKKKVDEMTSEEEKKD